MDYYQEVKEIARKKSFLHLESHHRGLSEALYTFLDVNGGKGIGESNQVLRERAKALHKIPFILRLFTTYSILLLADTSTLNCKNRQQLSQWVELNQLCPAWLIVVYRASVCRHLVLFNGSCVGLFMPPVAITKSITIAFHSIMSFKVKLYSQHLTKWRES